MPTQSFPPVSIEQTLAGGAGVVDLWFWFYDSPPIVKSRRQDEALLSDGEREIYRRFRFDKDRLRFLAGRSLLRRTLSRYAPVAPEAWRFEEGSHGKPRIVGPELHSPLYFNLTKTRGLVACAISCAHPLVGVDAERVDRQVEVHAVANGFFAPVEIASLLELPATEQQPRFYRYWTLKESYIKARGLGLSIPLNLFWFDVEGEDIGFSADESLGEAPGNWQFRQFRASPRHLIAVAAQTGGAPLSLRVREL